MEILEAHLSPTPQYAGAANKVGPSSELEKALEGSDRETPEMRRESIRCAYNKRRYG
jgi:hypothetical protein